MRPQTGELAVFRALSAMLGSHGEVIPDSTCGMGQVVMVLKSQAVHSLVLTPRGTGWIPSGYLCPLAEWENR